MLNIIERDYSVKVRFFTDTEQLYIELLDADSYRRVGEFRSGMSFINVSDIPKLIASVIGVALGDDITKEIIQEHFKDK